MIFSPKTLNLLIKYPSLKIGLKLYILAVKSVTGNLVISGNFQARLDSEIELAHILASVSRDTKEGINQHFFQNSALTSNFLNIYEFPHLYAPNGSIIYTILQNIHRREDSKTESKHNIQTLNRIYTMIKNQLNHSISLSILTLPSELFRNCYHQVTAIGVLHSCMITGLNTVNSFSRFLPAKHILSIKKVWSDFDDSIVNPHRLMQIFYKCYNM